MTQDSETDVQPGLASCSSLLALKAQRERETVLTADAARERALKKIENPQAGRSAILKCTFARVHHTTKIGACEDADIASRGFGTRFWEMKFYHETCRNVGE